jgi:hypothetical protein
MKYFFTLAGLAALISAQTVDDLPPCSVTCLLNGMKLAGCAVDDLQCACVNAGTMNNDISPCLKTACDSVDENTFRDLATQICKNVGVLITTQSNGEIALLDGMNLS